MQNLNDPKVIIKFVIISIFVIVVILNGAMLYDQGKDFGAEIYKFFFPSPK
ncbi:hypothetical protein ACN23B_10135 [Anabaena sp. FACHB-709]|uniref:Uncharacterized protein n=2 Tax=Nostocaceae TaxID=1162 RepID=A0A1Z4KFA9_ANAVA|nr:MULTISPECIES: hypothetical protein [Nostocaceae]MBD2173926.1 hypothetical protein [Anabaena cylindrica FACHB-318]RUR89632.1 hypothetical protein DSM107007_03180 [Nostoc sp. PCC 7120 = FACHB-418]BAY67645.1 hypothetical protein NIES23_04230 [Trichormus variabilis NIES-23]